MEIFLYTYINFVLLSENVIFLYFFLLYCSLYSILRCLPYYGLQYLRCLPLVTSLFPALLAAVEAHLSAPITCLASLLSTFGFSSPPGQIGLIYISRSN